MQLLPEVDIVIRAFDSGDNPLDTKDIFAATQDVRVFVIAMYPIHAMWGKYVSIYTFHQ